MTPGGGGCWARGATRPRAGGPLAQLRWRGVEDLQHRRVELADAGEAGRERDVAHRQAGRLGERPGGLRALRAAERQRAGPELDRQEAADLPLLVAEAAGEPGDALAVDHSVRDEPHRA